MGEDQALDQVRCVTYLLHPTFRQRVQHICDRGRLPGKGFAFSARGWGPFVVGITVEFRNGRDQLLTHHLNFDSDAQGWGTLNTSGQTMTLVLPVTAARLKDGHFRFSLTLDKDQEGVVRLTSVGIEVRDDGSPGDARWRFEILAGDEPWLPWFRLTERSYSDKRPPVRLTGASLIGDAVLPVSGDNDVETIRIVGFR